MRYRFEFCLFILKAEDELISKRLKFTNF